jgi:hypothetical protein
MRIASGPSKNRLLRLENVEAKRLGGAEMGHYTKSRKVGFLLLGH